MHNHHATTTTYPPRRSFLSRFHRAPRTTSRTTRHTTTAKRGHTTAARRSGPGLHRHKVAVKRKTTLGDKLSGAMMRLKGSLTQRPALKVAGAMKMHGTDGTTTRHY